MENAPMNPADVAPQNETLPSPEPHPVIPDTPEAAPNHEVSRERQVLELNRIGDTIQNDINRDLDRSPQEEQQRIFSSTDPESQMRLKLRLAHNMRAGTIIRNGAVPGIDPPITLPKQGGAQITSIERAEGEAYICRTADGSEISVGFTELANAHLAAEKAVILAGLPEEQRAAMELYIDSQNAVDSTEALAGKSPEEVNKAIMDAADSSNLALITQKDAELYVRTLGHIELNKLADTDPGYEAHRLDVIATINRRLEMINGDQPANLADTEGMATLINDTTSGEINTINDKLSSLPGDIERKQLEINEHEARLSSLPKNEQKSAGAEELRSNLVLLQKDLLELRTELETLGKFKAAVNPENIRRQVESIVNGSASWDDRARFKAGLNAENPDDLVTKLTEIDKSQIEKEIKDKDQQEKELARRKAQHEKRAAFAKKTAIGLGIASIAFLVMALSSAKGGQSH